MAWEAPGADFLRYRAPADCQLGPENRQQMYKNQYEILMIFWTRLFPENVRKLMPKASQNRCRNHPKSIPQGSRDENQKKYKKNHNTPSF